MASAVIGALRVDLGLNSAQFSAGLAKAQTGLKGFGKAAAVGFAAVAVAATAAAVAMGLGIKTALVHADALGKSAQKAGVAVEALSRLEYAAKLADVDLESLTGGLQKLNKSMVDVAGGKGPEAAFRALGIAVKDGLGNLRSGDAVFADIADRFSRMEDSALKTSLAMQIFGKSGAELIPLLNEGKDGLAALAAESDKVGYTLSGKTTAAAERFNDTITRMQLSLQGVFNKIIGDEGVMTALQSLATTIASPEFAQAMTTFANLIITAINLIAKAATVTLNALGQLRDIAQSTLYGDEYMSRDGVSEAIGVVTEQIEGLKSAIDSVNAHPGEWMDTMGGWLGATDADDIANFSADLATAEKRLEELLALKARWDASDPQTVPLLTLPTLPSIDLTDAVNSLEPLDLGLQDVEDSVTSLAETISNTLADSLTNIAEALLTGGDAVAAFSDELKNLGLQLLRSGLNSLFTNLLGGINPFGGAQPYVPGFGSVGVFGDGGISNVPAIFGENGAEAAVPLPDGRRIPVELRGNVGGGGTAVVSVQLSPELIGQVLEQANANTNVQIDNRAPAAVAKSNVNNRRG